MALHIAPHRVTARAWDMVAMACHLAVSWAAGAVACQMDVWWVGLLGEHCSTAQACNTATERGQGPAQCGFVCYVCEKGGG